MQEAAFQRYLTTLRVAFSLVLCASAAFFVYRSIHWQVMWDPSIMHYVNFLMDHGWAPYRDILDINLPGSYLAEGWAMHVFGGGDLGWRIYDFCLLGVMTASLIVIALPYDWFAGLYAGVIFLLMHAIEGAPNSGQREQVMITLIVMAYALLFTAMRRSRPLLLLPFGFLMGFAATFKPTAAPLGFLLLGMMWLALRKRGVRVRPYLAYGIAGLFLALLTTLAFFYKYHALGDFIAIARQLIPYYAIVGNSSKRNLFRVLVTPTRSIWLAIGLILMLKIRSRNGWENWERWVLGVGVAFGFFSYVLQGKPFEHHAYTFEVFILILSGLEFAKAMKMRGWLHAAGAIAIGLTVFVVVPSYDRRLAALDPRDAQPDAMKSDLIRLGGSSLQGQVQCLDMVDGCFGSLYRLHLVPYTGFMGDYMFFGPPGAPPLPYYRTMLWNALHTHPAKVVVLTDMWLTQGNSFNKFNQWPELMAYLNTAYRLDVARSFPRSGYKIYVLRTDAQPLH